MTLDPILTIFLLLVLVIPFFVCSLLLVGMRPLRDIWPFSSRTIVPLEHRPEMRTPCRCPMCRHQRKATSLG